MEVASSIGRKGASQLPRTKTIRLSTQGSSQGGGGGGGGQHPPTLIEWHPKALVDFCVFSYHSTKMHSVVTTRGFIKAHLSGVKLGARPIRCILHGKDNFGNTKNG